ncbi:hypothetical protein APHAL10511_003058 [Amanita phalloides]|nr:hypothetical protein APHAL10511_003058 [Amanita phalloides]
MITSTAVADIATNTSQPITRITRDDFIQQGLDIVHAYANDCHLSIVFPEHGPAQLAEWIWKRRADKNGTIPLLPQHVAVKLSNGQLRIMDRNSEAKLAVDEVDCPPMVPPDLDESHVLPTPFMRFKQEDLRATTSSSQGEEEELDFPADGLPLERFPSPPDARSPPILPIRNFASSASSQSPERGTPELDIIYPPRGRTILGLDGHIIDEEKLSPGWLNEMQRQVCKKRRRLKRMLEDSQVELAQAVLEMQKAKSDLDASVTDSRQMLEHLKNLFGTKRMLKVMDVAHQGRKGKLRKTYFDNIDAVEDVSLNGFGQDDDSSSSDSSGSRLVTRSSRPNSEPATNNNGNPVRLNHVSSANNQAHIGHDGATNTSNKENEQVKVPDAVTASSSHNLPVNEGQASHSSRPANIRSPRKRTRDEVDDSEIEVELSVLYGPESDSVKRRRLYGAARSLPGTKSPAGSQENRNPGSQGRQSSQRTRSKGVAKDRRPKREMSVFLTSPSPFRLEQIPEKDRAKFAPMIKRFGLDKDEPERPWSPRLSPDSPRRKHSTSGIIPYQGGHLYIS